MELLEMFPPVTECEISIAGEKKQIQFNEVTLKDHIWCLTEYKMEIHEFLMEYSGDLEAICRLMFRQFSNESKLIFKERGMTVIDEDGKEERSSIGGYKLLYFYLKTEEDYAKLIEAYKNCYLCSLPVKSEESKKKAKMIAKIKKKLMIGK